jgi:hypothetical protein
MSNLSHFMRHNNKIIIGTMVLASIIAIVYFWHLSGFVSPYERSFTQSRSNTVSDAKGDTEKQYIPVNGFSGTIKEISAGYITLSTVAMPYDDVKTKVGDTWIWRVELSEATEILQAAPSANEPDDEIDLYQLSPIDISRLLVGDIVTVTTSNDLKKQYSLASKVMQAKMITVAYKNIY